MMEPERIVQFYKDKKCVIGLCGDLWDYPERFALGEDLLLWPVYVCWTKEEWENVGKLEYAGQAKLCCENTLYALAEMDVSKYKDSMSPLILKDVEALRNLL